MGKAFERLPKALKPVHYKVDLTPNIDENKVGDVDGFKIKGEQTVDLQVIETTSQVKFNSLDIEIISASVNGVNICPDAIVKDAENEAVTITLAEPLVAGETATLCMSFIAELNDKLKGFYRSNYLKDGEKKVCGVTQFESTDARRCLPCWDEPAVKSRFTCSLTVPKGLTALSNMPITSSTDVSDTHVKHQFAESPIMSTYLLAFYVGESEYVSKNTKHNVEVRVFTPLGKKSHGQFALDMGVACLEFYEEFFNIAYPLPKCDQIGLDDFAAGAMENWGLVTYRSNLLLVDPENSSASTKQSVAIVVAHELAHQWFGNLVTMEWWTHLWLNEGFASFMEYLATDAVHPEYDIFDHFVKDDFRAGMELDALDSSHAIEIPVNHPSEVDEIFDNISYCKGASVIRMLHSWIGNDNFRSGMKNYLGAFKYKNTLTEDLWGKLEQASKLPVATVMSTWTSQMGFPLVRVSKLNDTTIRVTQEKFSANGKSDSDKLWNIPIELCNADSPTTVVQKFVLYKKSEDITLDCPSDWTKLNCGSCGFYRVKYDDDIAAKLDVSKMLTRDRLQLQGDMFALAKAGYVPITDYLKLLEGYNSESDYTVLAAILGNLGDISKVIWNMDKDTQQGFREWRIGFLSHAMNKVGFVKKAGESHGDSLLRSSLIRVLGALGDDKVVSWCQDAFTKHTAEKPELIAGDLRGAVFGTVAAQAKCGAVIDQLIILWEQNAESQEEQSHVESGICAVKSPDNIKKVGDFIRNKVKMCNKPFSYVGLCNTSLAGCDATWAYVSQNFEEVKLEFTGFLRQAIVARTFQAYGTMEKHNEIKGFFDKNPMEGAERAIPQMLEKIAGRAAMLERGRESLATYKWSSK